MIVAVLESETKLELGQMFVFRMMFTDIEKAMSHFKFDPSMKGLHLNEIGKNHYLGSGYDQKDRYISVQIYLDKVY